MAGRGVAAQGTPPPLRTAPLTTTPPLRTAPLATAPPLVAGPSGASGMLLTRPALQAAVRGGSALGSALVSGGWLSPLLGSALGAAHARASGLVRVRN